MSRPAPLPKMMVGFVVRRCAVALGHDPTPEEFARWANEYREGERVVCIFGRPITVAEARLILGHRARPVSARSAAPHEVVEIDANAPKPGNVRSLARARVRLAERAKARR